MIFKVIPGFFHFRKSDFTDEGCHLVNKTPPISTWDLGVCTRETGDNYLVALHIYTPLDKQHTLPETNSFAPENGWLEA